MSLASQRAITTSNALRLIDDHCPLMFAFRRITGGIAGTDGARPGSDGNSNSSQLEEFTSVDVFFS